MKDLTKKSRSKGRMDGRSKGSMDAQNRWWVAELLAKVWDKACTQTGWEDTMQEWYEWLENMKKKDENEKTWRRCISERWRR